MKARIFPSLINANLLNLESVIHTLNPHCDGYHIVEAWFFEGEFAEFRFFAGPEAGKNFYRAWAKLPETTTMYDLFARND